MTTDQILLFTLLGFVFLFLIWGRWRYDLVAISALMIGLLSGIVPVDAAFSGFGHPATVIIALVLILSRALSNSGAVELVARQVMERAHGLFAHIALMSGIGAAFSALINNVAALALLMPVDIQAAHREGRSPSLTLMPLSFATILGGMITLIGTPPNIVIAEFRREAMGEGFKMFDFAPVGLACAVIGVLFIATIGWRLIPAADRDKDAAKALFDLDDYIAEVEAAEGSPAIGRQVRDLDPEADDSEVAVVGLVRGGQRMPGMARRVEIQAGDILVLEAGAEAIDKFLGLLKLEYVRRERDKGFLTDGDLSLIEVAVPEGARIEGRSALSLRLLYRHGMTLLGVSRQGKRFTERVRRLEIRAGDVLLLLGPGERLTEIANWLGCLPLAERGLEVLQRGKSTLAIAIFAGAVGLASTGVLYLPVALGCAAALMVALNIVPLRQVYESVEWSVIVLLGSMIPLGAALEASGGTGLIAGGIVSLAEGFSPIVVLVLLIIVTMTLSDVMNNTATAVIAAPIAVDIATRLGVNADPFLMGVAVAASCAFLTPIGHQNNALIMGPGGYRFGDYWRVGLPLEAIIVALGIPLILWAWPL